MFNFGWTDKIQFAITKCKVPVLQFPSLAVSLTLIYNAALFHFQTDKKKKNLPRLHIGFFRHLQSLTTSNCCVEATLLSIQSVTDLQIRF